MKRSKWVRLIAVILIISMLAAPVSAATYRGHDSVGTNGMIGVIVDIIRHIIRDIFDDWFDKPGEEEPVPTNPADPTAPTVPGETEPVETDPTEPGVTDPTEPGVTDPTEPGETRPGETDPTEPGEDEDESKTSLELVEGHANTENGHLLRGVTYTLGQVIAQQSSPVTTTTANRFGTKLGANAASSGLKPMGSKVTTLAEGDTETTVSDTALEITTDDLGPVIPDGNYIIRYNHASYGSYMTSNTSSGWPWYTTFLLGTTDESAATHFTFTRQNDGTYTIQAPDGTYMDITGNNSGEMTAVANYFTIEMKNDGIWIRDFDDNVCVNALGADFSGYTEKYYGGYSNGTPLELYAVTTTTEPEEPEEPEQPEETTTVVYFPVTMFNYNNGTTELNDDSIMRNLTHQAEVKAGLKELWEGLYFSGGTPASTSYTYTASAATHTDLTWQQVMNGTYYADEACTNQAVVTEIIEGSGEYESVTISVGDIWNAFGGNADGTWYPTTYKYLSYGNYCTVAIQRPAGVDYFLLGYQGNASMPDFYYQLGYFNASDDAILYAVAGTVTGYNLVAGGETLATLNGTNTSEQIGVSLYTAGGTKTVNKFYSRWNWWAYRDNSEGPTDAQNKFYTGLVQDELVDGEIVFNVVEPGIFTFDSSDPTTTNDGIKDIYQNVGLPFVKNATREGFYTFDSDAHGTYFADTNNDGKSDPGYGTSDNYFNMYFDYQRTQGWSGMYYGDGSSKLWAPYNTNVNDSSEGNIDYHFGMRADIPFSMTPNGCVKSTDDNSEHIEFSFAGDDDVWIFIDGHLVIDLGGIHNRIGATIDFADNTITYERPESNVNTLSIGSYNDPEKYKLNDDGTITVKLYNDTEGEGALGQTRVDFSSEEEHVMSIFYLERGKGTSNCKIEFNLPMRDTVLITKDATKSWSEAQDEQDGENGDGTVQLTAKEQAAVDKLNFGFTLFKKTADETEFTAVKNTNFFVQNQDGEVIGSGSTDGNGKFYLKNGQTAKFMTDIPKEGITYYVIEDAVPEGFLTPDYKYAGVATWGYDYIGEAILTDENGDYILDADGNLTSGIVSGTVANAADMGEHELPMDAAANKSYEVTVKGSVESIDSIEFICTNYLDERLPNPTALAYEDMIVLDYGLSVQVDPLANDLFRGNDIEIVAWGDETLELNEVLDNNGHAIPYGEEGGTTWTNNKVLSAAKVAASASSYNDELIDLADCLYTFKADANGFYEVSGTAADGTKVYLNHYSSGNTNPNIVSPAGKIAVSAGTEQNMFKLVAQPLNNADRARTLHFHAEKGMPYWNRCRDDDSKRCQEYLYRPAGKDDVSSTQIPGYVMVTSLDEIVDGGQYLIVHDSEVDDNLYVLHPSTSTGQWDHVAKLETTNAPAIGSAFSFDFGTVKFNDVTYSDDAHDTFEYTLTKQLTEVEVISYIVKVTSTIDEVIGGVVGQKTACRYALAKVYIAPATIMYYEENFSDMILFEGVGWDDASTVANANNVSPYQEPGVVGTIDDSTYGSDVAYLSDNGDSNGTYRFGNTTEKAIRFTYTFTGTGTSIFARTSDKTGYMQVKIYEGEDTNGELMNISYRDTYWKDTNEVNEGGSTLYSIPVFTDEDLGYGTYTVVCTVAKAGTYTAGNDNGAGNEFYLDGIRIMQPLNVDAQNQELVEKTLDAYVKDNEANLDVVTLRQKLLTDYPTIDGEPEEDEIIAPEEEWPFVVLTDVNDQIVLSSDYKSIGPKEEVYLAATDTGITNAQTVSFSLKFWEPEGLKLYMGMKAPFGSAKVNIGHNVYELNNAPDCYYDVTDNYESLVTEIDEYGNEYYVVTYTFEAAESIVSLTNIKVVGSHEFTIVENTDIEN